MPIITPLGAPALTNPSGSTVSSRDRAVAKLVETMNQSQTTPVQNPNQVSPEELSAVKAPSESGQVDNNVETSSTAEPKEATPAKSKEEELLSSQYAVFARKEKAQRLRDQQLRAREEAIKAKEAALAPPAQPAFDQSKYISKDVLLGPNALKILSEEIGLSYDHCSVANYKSQVFSNCL